MDLFLRSVNLGLQDTRIGNAVLNMSLTYQESRRRSAAMLVAVLAGENPVSGTCPRFA